MANIFGRNGGYARSDKTPATSSRHEGKSVPRPARAEKYNVIELASLRQQFRANSFRILPGKENTKMWKSIARKFRLHRDAEALQHSH